MIIELILEVQNIMIETPISILTVLLMMLVILLISRLSYFAIPILAFCYKYWKRIKFETMLVVHVIEGWLSLWPWYSAVTDKIYLGGLPVLTKHRELLLKTLHIDSVLSINESFELNSITLVGTPMNENEWNSFGKEFLQLVSPDDFPVPISLLNQGADFLHIATSRGRTVYCHCKSGVGRSASVVACFLIKYQNYSAADAQSFLYERRPVIFNKQSIHMNQILQYEQMLQSCNNK